MFIDVIYQHPVTWQPSKDGDRLIGRILLNKRLKDGSVPRDSGAMLGLKVCDEIGEMLYTPYRFIRKAKDIITLYQLSVFFHFQEFLNICTHILKPFHFQVLFKKLSLFYNNIYLFNFGK